MTKLRVFVLRVNVLTQTRTLSKNDVGSLLFSYPYALSKAMAGMTARERAITARAVGSTVLRGATALPTERWWLWQRARSIFGYNRV